MQTFLKKLFDFELLTVILDFNEIAISQSFQVQFCLQRYVNLTRFIQKSKGHLGFSSNCHSHFKSE